MFDKIKRKSFNNSELNAQYSTDLKGLLVEAWTSQTCHETNQ